MDDSQTAFATQYQQYGLDLDMMKVCLSLLPHSWSCVSSVHTRSMLGSRSVLRRGNLGCSNNYHHLCFSNTHPEGGVATVTSVPCARSPRVLVIYDQTFPHITICSQPLPSSLLSLSYFHSLLLLVSFLFLEVYGFRRWSRC